MTDRRNFIKELSAIGMLSAFPKPLTSRLVTPKEKIWGCFLSLGFNEWESYIYPGRPFRGYRPYLRLNKSLWDNALESMAKEGMNMVVINTEDAVKYKSHPEIAVEGAWSTDMLRQELKKIRQMGLEPIPLLNFSAAHDTWLKTYSRMVSTKDYYSVCSDLIAEVIDLFDNPRFVHIGMDEENASNQVTYDYIVVRQNDLWWGDFYFLIGEVEKSNARPWIWSDYIWHHQELFLERMPKSVIQSNWYYDNNFDIQSLSENSKKFVEAYNTLNSNGFDQIPTGGFLVDGNDKENILNTVKYCSTYIADDKLLGFLQTFWRPTIEEYGPHILEGIRLAGEAKQLFEKNRA